MMLGARTPPSKRTCIGLKRAASGAVRVRMDLGVRIVRSAFMNTKVHHLRGQKVADAVIEATLTIPTIAQQVRWAAVNNINETRHSYPYSSRKMVKSALLVSHHSPPDLAQSDIPGD
jgi:hypothetical protein